MTEGLGKPFGNTTGRGGVGRCEQTTHYETDGLAKYLTIPLESWLVKVSRISYIFVCTGGPVYRKEHDISVFIVVPQFDVPFCSRFI